MDHLLRTSERHLDDEMRCFSLFCRRQRWTDKFDEHTERWNALHAEGPYASFRESSMREWPFEDKRDAAILKCLRPNTTLRIANHDIHLTFSHLFAIRDTPKWDHQVWDLVVGTFFDDISLRTKIITPSGAHFGMPTADREVKVVLDERLEASHGIMFESSGRLAPACVVFHAETQAVDAVMDIFKEYRSSKKPRRSQNDLALRKVDLWVSHTHTSLDLLQTVKNLAYPETMDEEPWTPEQLQWEIFERIWKQIKQEEDLSGSKRSHDSRTQDPEEGRKLKRPKFDDLLKNMIADSEADSEANESGMEVDEHSPMATAGDVRSAKETEAENNLAYVQARSDGNQSVGAPPETMEKRSRSPRRVLGQTLESDDEFDENDFYIMQLGQRR